MSSRVRGDQLKPKFKLYADWQKETSSQDYPLNYPDYYVCAVPEVNVAILSALNESALF
jgi:hypothetical protein